MIRKTSIWCHPNGRWKFHMRDWFCCGMEWQLLLSERWPKRVFWNPTCPKCGSTCTEDSKNPDDLGRIP